MSAMERVSTQADLDALRAGFERAGERVALVPTMGNLHAGHLALIDLARRHADRVIATVFVNPTQFGPNEDFARYPRTLDADASALAARGADVLFAPDLNVMYPDGSGSPAAAVAVTVPALENELCGAFRPGHFRGVATVVAKLFHRTRPHVAVFGEKDFQQLVVIRALVSALDFAIEVIAAPTARAADGLALSSRNQYLDAADRGRAPRLYAALMNAAARINAGDAIEDTEKAAAATLAGAGFRVDYVAVRAAADLSRFANNRPDSGAVVLGAAWLGATRLIDNVRLMR